MLKGSNKEYSHDTFHSVLEKVKSTQKWQKHSLTAEGLGTHIQELDDFMAAAVGRMSSGPGIRDRTHRVDGGTSRAD